MTLDMDSINWYWQNTARHFLRFLYKLLLKGEKKKLLKTQAMKNMEKAQLDREVASYFQHLWVFSEIPASGLLIGMCYPRQLTYILKGTIVSLGLRIIRHVLRDSMAQEVNHKIWKKITVCLTLLWTWIVFFFFFR